MDSDAEEEVDLFTINDKHRLMIILIPIPLVVL